MSDLKSSLCQGGNNNNQHGSPSPPTVFSITGDRAGETTVEPYMPHTRCTYTTLSPVHRLGLGPKYTERMSSPLQLVWNHVEADESGR
mmetsp:Transcript_12535/g.21210  ORF Transcript_12535/g.21210 Transcript_12535/m.21210 type:complete len:88 (+) Transcript_12535:942-1205(+)